MGSASIDKVIKGKGYIRNTIGVEDSSEDFVIHIEERLRAAANKDNRLSLEEFAVKVRQRRMEKYGF